MFKYDNIVFRAVDEEDLKTLYFMRRDEDINDMLFTLYPISMFNQKNWLQNMLQSQTDKVFMVDEIVEQQTIACVRLSNIDFINRKMEVGCDILSNFRGKGFCSKIYESLLKYCFDEMGMNQVYLHVLSNNEKAIKCYESVGFTKVCVLREWVWKKGGYQDVELYSVFTKDKKQ
jgi:RimJ/RimL family protein N-acetyltransferase